jgi:hypothetical protein
MEAEARNNNPGLLAGLIDGVGGVHLDRFAVDEDFDISTQAERGAEAAEQPLAQA